MEITQRHSVNYQISKSHIEKLEAVNVRYFNQLAKQLATHFMSSN